ncbi:MAG: spore germination protein [Symbiobacteriaceae bacterium]|jgi:spore germination protein KA|nr:spore germination protein [Symbiobacteriaceae bacterium]
MGRAASTDLKSNIQYIKQQLGNSFDLIHRTFVIGGGREGALFSLDGMVDGARLDALFQALVALSNPPFQQPQVAADPTEQVMATIYAAGEVRTVTDLDQVVDAILQGQWALFLDGSPRAMVADLRKPPSRGVEEPSTETETRGPRDGFTEDIVTNIALVRRRIRDPRLRVDPITLGRRTKTDVVMIYIDGLAKPSLVKEVDARLRRIDADSVLESGYVEEMIQDNPRSIFGILNYTERPDKLAGNLIEGRVGIIVDNSPFVLIVPTSFWQWFQASGDYYQSYMTATAYRLTRILALIIGLIGPSLYTMLSSFHHEMIPTPLALSMAAGREGTPLPTLFEVLSMTITFEIIHEAGLRLPRAVGQTVSIVGALVIGEAAVTAGLAAPATIIVVAAAGLAAFALPFYAGSLAIRLVRIPLLILSGTLGVFGFVAGTTFLAMHAASLRSFGEPFLGPLVPLQTGELRDTLIREPWWSMRRRPGTAANGQRRRQGRSVQEPAPPGGRSS